MKPEFWIGAVVVCAVLAGSADASVVLTHERADAARTALNRGRADDALEILDAALKEDPNDAEAFNLRCRVFYAEERWDEAIADCSRSVQIESGNSRYHMWLGRVYGRKAQRVSFVTAYKLAKQIRVEFETAANLDPRNGEALSDLGEYYTDAPAVLGGGYNKAETIAKQLEGFAPVRALDLRAQMAEAKKDYADAETQLRAKISASHSSAQSWMDLGSFYCRHERWDEMLAALQSGAAAADRDHGPALADGAATLMKAGREPKLAIEWMRAYLASDALSEEEPAFVVHARLGTLLKQQGDPESAQKEFAGARALAKDYAGLAAAEKAHWRLKDKDSVGDKDAEDARGR